MNEKRHLKRYCIKDIHEALLVLARLHIQKYSSVGDDFWSYQRDSEHYGLRSELWEYDWNERHRAQIYLKLNDDMCSALRMPKDSLLEAFVALAPSYVRYYPRFWNLMEAVDVNIRIDGLTRTVRRASLNSLAVELFLRKHSLSELQQMRDQVTGIQMNILLNERQR